MVGLHADVGLQGPIGDQGDVGHAQMLLPVGDPDQVVVLSFRHPAGGVMKAPPLGNEGRQQYRLRSLCNAALGQALAVGDQRVDGQLLVAQYREEALLWAAADNAPGRCAKGGTQNLIGQLPLRKRKPAVPGVPHQPVEVELLVPRAGWGTPAVSHPGAPG